MGPEGRAVNRRQIGAVALASAVTVLVAFAYFYLSHKGRMPDDASEFWHWVAVTGAVVPLAILSLGIGWLVGHSRASSDKRA
jgi:hypothetical protein